jgi:predicted DNA-binding transcriptional regulator AlpA
MSATANVLPFPLERRQARRLVDVAGLMQAFGYSERWWRYRISEGMPRHTWGKRHRFDPSEVEQWLEQRYGS